MNKDVKVEATKEVAPESAPAVKRERKKRTPVSGARDILTVRGIDPNFSYRWVVDQPGRVQRFQDGGWEVVPTHGTEVGQATVDRGSQLGSVVTKASGDGRTLVLMRIPKEWYDEDQVAKAERINAHEATMKAEAQVGRYGVLEVTRPKKQ